MNFRDFSQRYFNFNTSQKAGIISVLLIICAVYFLPAIIFKTQNKSLNLKIDNSVSDSIKTFQNAEKPPKPHYEKKKTEFNPFYFDPNVVNPNELKRFALPDYVINNFEKYRNSGAVFKTKDDFKRIYGLKPEWYQKIEPFIKIDFSKNKTAEIKYEKKETKKENFSVEINSADSAKLVKIKGIGAYLASKIIKYRNALGGFVNTSQLYEIFNVKKEMVDTFVSQVSVDISLIKKINVNTAVYDDLKKHPYLNGREASAIVNYRKQHGLFNTIEDLKKIILLKSETIVKIEPYLEF